MQSLLPETFNSVNVFEKIFVLVDRLSEATKKGYEYAVENPKEAAKMLLDGDSTGALRANEELVYKSQEWVSKQYVDDAKSFGMIFNSFALEISSADHSEFIISLFCFVNDIILLISVVSSGTYKE